MVGTPPMVAYLCCGEVSVYIVMLFQRGLGSVSLLSAKSSLELPTIFLTSLSSY
jgi:hypothetical protein